MPTNITFILAVTWCILGFAIYYFLSNNKAFAGRIGKLSRKLDSQGNQVLIQRILGLLFLGIFSALIIILHPGLEPMDYGLNFTFLAAPPWWSYLVIPLILVMGINAARQKGNLELYPQIRSRNWTPGMIVISGMSWVLFLLGYEFLFRGFLLHASLDIMAAGPAIALNCALYAFAHFYKGPGETFGAIPIGALLCYLTLVTGNIWCAVVIHALMALSNEWFSLYFHPEMEIVKAR